MTYSVKIVHILASNQLSPKGTHLQNKMLTFTNEKISEQHNFVKKNLQSLKFSKCLLQSLPAGLHEMEIHLKKIN